MMNPSQLQQQPQQQQQPRTLFRPQRTNTTCGIMTVASLSMMTLAPSNAPYPPSMGMPIMGSPLSVGSPIIGMKQMNGAPMLMKQMRGFSSPSSLDQQRQQQQQRQ
mmetsp:Transcript_55760/g.60334  ORF Transcript_55760/g.60334 Transcript_55760/m.60334 type:complete len:106 (+) Transcript_55760:932-1249(+)